MSELTDEIVNKGIAEFMGYEVVTWNEPHIQGTALFNKEKQEFITGNYYTESLDALVPVWEKYKIAFEVLPQGNGYTFLVMSTDIWVEEKTIQQAAAYATYKAIKELRDE
jgi:hypothetical protein